MSLTELDRDNATGLALAVDTSDPQRYYLVDRRRRDLLTIGDLPLARARFLARVKVHQEEQRAAAAARPLFARGFAAAASG
jgi:hypothetical protein